MVRYAREANASVDGIGVHVGAGPAQQAEHRLPAALPAMSRKAMSMHAIGALGIAGYLGHLSHKVFKDSLAFPFVLMLIGLGVVWLGVLWQRNEGQIVDAIESWLPSRLHRTGGRTK